MKFSKRGISLRRDMIVWLFVCVLVIFPAYQSFDHTCLDHSPAPEPGRSFLETGCACVPGSVYRPDSQSPTSNHGNGVCLACLWSQSLLIRDASPGLALPQLGNAKQVFVSEFVIAHRGFFHATLKRGPPAA